MPVLFCNVGWMERYRGLNQHDHIMGGGAYVRTHGRGFEVCNFSAHEGMLYGYVQPPGAEIDLERLGGRQNDDSLDGVTVFWTATRPTGGTAVVGWYKNATVFRNFQKFSTKPEAHRDNNIEGYRISGRESDAKLLSVDERAFEIPRQIRGGMGQANVWYADAPESRDLVRKLIAVVNGSGIRMQKKYPKTRTKQDQERKIRVEKAAIRACCDHFEALGYEVTSVEKDNCGWDLEAVAGKSKLRIEVKGLSANTFAVELTANEYDAFVERAADYRLAVVMGALSKRSLRVCRYSPEQSAWLVEEDNRLSVAVAERLSATIRVS
jgi:hypothetical protein